MDRNGKKKILIVDDVKLFQLFLKQSLMSDKYDLLFADTGKQAIELALQENIDLLILDLELPDINGLEVLRKVKMARQEMESIVQLASLPVIMVTAYPSKEARLEAERLNVAVFLTKPIKKQRMREVVEQTLQGEYPGESLRKLILCVDSEPRVQKFYKRTLTSGQQMVSCVSDALAALEKVEFEKPHLIITEMNLSEMSGLELIQTLKETSQNIPVIVVSSTTSKENLEKAKELGVYQYLTKPFHLKELITAVKESLVGNGDADRIDKDKEKAEAKAEDKGKDKDKDKDKDKEKDKAEDKEEEKKDKEKTEEKEKEETEGKEKEDKVKAKVEEK